MEQLNFKIFHTKVVARCGLLTQFHVVSFLRDDWNAPIICVWNVFYRMNVEYYRLIRKHLSVVSNIVIFLKKTVQKINIYTKYQSLFVHKKKHREFHRYLENDFPIWKGWHFISTSPCLPSLSSMLQYKLNCNHLCIWMEYHLCACLNRMVLVKSSVEGKWSN